MSKIAKRKSLTNREKVWDNIEDVLSALSDIDTIGAVQDEVVRPLRAIRDWGAALIASAALLSFISALVYFTIPSNEQTILFSIIAIIAELLFLVPATKIQRNFKTYREATRLLRSNSLI